MDLTQDVKELYTENYSTLKKDWGGHQDMERYPLFPDRLNQKCQNDHTHKIDKWFYNDLNQNANCALHRLEKTILSFIQNQRGPRTAEEVPRNKCKVGCITMLDFKSHYKATVVKTAWCWHKQACVSMEQKSTPNIFNFLNLDKGDARRKKTSLTKSADKTGCPQGED